jgi:ATP-dependent Clp protease adaptor protein ClpS
MGGSARTGGWGEMATAPAITGPGGMAGGLLPTLAGGGGNGDDGGTEGGVKVKTRTKTKRPSLYKVLMLNDDYTPMEFVVYVLQRFFGMDHTRAVDVMLTVHNKGVAVVGVYPYEVAETKVMQVMDCARSNQHPLQCTLEKE